MGDIRIETWNDFLATVDSLYASPPEPDFPGSHVSELLFRGQSDATWKLETTLERWAGEGVSLGRYYIDVSSVQHEIESRTGHSWTIPAYPEYRDALAEREHFYPRPGELYEYLAYLRHHGFPSPLLDWTASPFIAAYFAFRSATPDRDVAIYGYREYAGAGKALLDGGPEVDCLGPYLRTHQRHYLQQCQYTVCVEGKGVNRKYSSHERVLSERNKDQDLLWKFVLPGALKRTALTYLQRHNIDAYSLLNSEEALMESVAMKQFVLKRRR